MLPGNLILRCYAEKKSGYWQAFCLDLTLAAQGESFEEVRTKLSDMIDEYVHDAVNGEDKEHEKQLLGRRAPIKYWIKYGIYGLLSFVLKLRGDFARTFNQSIPLIPVTRHLHA